MLSISRLLLVVLCANAYVSAAADAKFPSRFDMQLVNLQSLDAGDSFSYEAVTSIGLSVSPAADGLDAYTFSFDGAVLSGNQLPTMTMGVTDRLSYTFQRDPKSQEIFSNDIDAGAMRQVNAYFAALGGAQTRTGRWTERARIFSPAYIDLPGENPNVAFNVRSASHDGSEIKIADYNSEQFSFRTTVGQTVRARFVGYIIGTDDWRVPLVSGFALIGDIEETDGVRIPLAVRRTTLAVHPVTGREYLDPTRYVDAGLVRQISAASVFDAGSKSQQVLLPNWLSDIHKAALHANALSGAIAEGRSNMEPMTAAGAAAAVGTAIVLDTAISFLWNTAVDGVRMVKGEKKLSEYDPFDTSESYKTRGLFGGLSYLAGKGVEKASIAVGVDKNTARKLGLGTEVAGNLSTILAPTGAVKAIATGLKASKAIKAANTTKAITLLDKSIDTATAAKTLGMSKNAVKLARQPGKLWTALTPVGKSISKSARKHLMREGFAAARKAGLPIANNLHKSRKVYQVGKLHRVGNQIARLGNFSVQTADYLLTPSNLIAHGIFKTADTLTDANKFINIANVVEPELNLSLFPSGKEAVKNVMDLGSSYLYRPIQPEINSVPTTLPTTFRNATFTPPPALGPSTGGFTDAAILLPLRFRVFDTAVEDGDIVRLEVRSSNGVNLGPTNVTLTNAGQIFSPAVAAGPVQVTLTAVNEGSLPPNTGGLNILSTVTRGQSNQEFSLQTGGSGSLNIVADPPSTPQIAQPSPL